MAGELVVLKFGDFCLQFGLKIGPDWAIKDMKREKFDVLVVEIQPLNISSAIQRSSFFLTEFIQIMC